MIIENISYQAAPKVINALQQIAKTEGRQLEIVVNEALREYIEQKSNTRSHILAAFSESVDEFDSLYRELAK